MSGVYGYSQTAASNTTTDGVSIAENMNPANVNNAMRGILAEIAEWRDDTSGTITSGGTANAQTLTTNSTITSYADGMKFSFVAGANNTGSTTLNVDGVGAKSVRKSNVDSLTGGEIRSGAHYIVQYDASAVGGAGAFLLLNPDYNNDDVDINGGSIDGATIGANSAAAANFTTVDATGIIEGGGSGSYTNAGQAIQGTSTSNTASLYSSAAASSNTVLSCERSASGDHIRFYRNGVLIGEIFVNASTVSYNTTSDYRLKENVVSLVDYDFGSLPSLPEALSRVMRLRPVSYNFKADPGNTMHGFIAHELQEVIPSAVNREKDQTVEVGTVKVKRGDRVEVMHNVMRGDAPEGAKWEKTGEKELYQTIDPSKTIADLTAAVQALTLMVLELKR